MCFAHYRRRREPPVSLRGGDSRVAFIVHGHALFFILCSRPFATVKLWALGTFPVYIRKPNVFLPLLAATGAASVPKYRLSSFELYIAHVKFLKLVLVLPNICNGKTTGLGTFPIYIRKPHVVLPLLAASGAASVPLSLNHFING